MSSFKDRNIEQFNKDAAAYDKKAYIRVLAGEAATEILNKSRKAFVIAGAHDDGSLKARTCLDVGGGSGLVSELLAPHFKLVGAGLKHVHGDLHVSMSMRSHVAAWHAASTVTSAV